MSEMPGEIWLQAPIDTPENEWKGNDQITWCWHSIDENDGPDTKYLRADTCVSKEKLEKLLNDWKFRFKYQAERNQALADCIRELGEVMK